MSARAHHRNVSGSCAIEALTNGIHLVFGLWSPSPRTSQSSPGPPGPSPVQASPNDSVGDGISNNTYPPTSPSPPVASHIPNISGSIGSSNLQPNVASANMSVTSPALTNGSTHRSLRPCSLATWIMGTLEKGARVASPLHSLARTILDGCEIFEATHINAEAYDTMASELNAMAANLKRHMHNISSESCSGDIAQIEESIQRCSSHIDQQRIRNRRRQVLESGRGQEDIVNSRHKVESIYRGVQAIASEAILHRTKRQLEDVLLRNLGHVEDARFNSDFAPQIRRRGCTPGTRVGIQDDIMAWTGDPESKRLWIHGGLGTGKTTIAYTTCERLQKENALGASYFCTRTSSECGSLRRLIPTIAYQLATRLPVFQSALCTVLEKQRDCPSLEPQWQFYWLLSEPLQAIRDTVSKDLVIVIDGIDECEDHYFMRQVLGQILSISLELPIKILITSRFEPVIDSTMSSVAHPLTRIDLHHLDPLLVRGDIKIYLTESLEKMSPPLTSLEIERLADLSENSFIYAATEVEYILPPHTEGSPADRLQTILDITSPAGIYKPLYSLYSTVLKKALDRNSDEKALRNLQLVLWTVICAKEPMTVQTIARLIGIKEVNVTASLRSLHSVLHVKKGSGHVTVHHTSFYDYIHNSVEAGQFYCDDRVHGDFLARRCFEIMELQLKFNICNLESSFIPDSDILDLERRVKEFISVELSYACRYWSDHLEVTIFSEELCSMLFSFLSTQLLYWMEVLKLQGYIGDGVKILGSIRTWLQGNDRTATMELLVDAWNFVARFAGNRCAASTPHIYISALSFCPNSSLVHRNYWPLFSRLRTIIGLNMNHTQDAALARWTAEAPVSSLVCSSDGARVALGFYDGSIQIWDTQTGIMIGSSVESHDGLVCSLRFSHDSARLASGSHDQSICLYDVTGTDPSIIHRLIGHEGPVFALNFSSDSTRIVSGSSNGTVQVWDAETGNSIDEPLRGELEILSVSFSTDDVGIIAIGLRMAATHDAVIQSWNILDPDRPTIIQTLSSHKGPVTSIDVSLDGTLVATGGSDRTIRLWQTATGMQIGQPLKGHTGEVLVIKFLPDGTRLISGSADKTIRVWDIGTGSPIGCPFEGHSSSVGVMVPVPGDTRVISSSGDAIIRIWDVDMATRANTLVHRRSEPVCSVAFSLDNDLILSGSDDKGIRIWDACTGKLLDMPVEHTDSILSVAFSPNNKRYAAVSRDGDILVGDILPGPRFGKPTVRRIHHDPILSIAFSKDESCLVTSCGRTIGTWNTHTLEAVGPTFKEQKGSVTEIALARRGDLHLVACISNSDDKTIQSFNLKTAAKAAPEMKGHQSSIISIACSPGGDLIVSGSWGRTIRVWDGHTGKEIVKPIAGHTGPVRSVALFEFPNGTRMIASGSDDQTVRLWKAETGEPIGNPLTGHTDQVLSVAFSANGEFVVSGSADGTIRLWGIKSLWSSQISQPGFQGTVGHQSGSGSDSKSQSSNVREARSWTLRNDGWIVDDEKLLFWVLLGPRHDLNPILELSNHSESLITCIDSYEGAKSLNLTIGGDWMTCTSPGQ